MQFVMPVANLLELQGHLSVIPEQFYLHISHHGEKTTSYKGMNK